MALLLKFVYLTSILSCLFSMPLAHSGSIFSKRVDLTDSIRKTRRIMREGGAPEGKSHWMLSTTKGNWTAKNPDRLSIVNRTGDDGSFESLEATVDPGNFRESYHNPIFNEFKMINEEDLSFQYISKLKYRQAKLKKVFSIADEGSEKVVKPQSVSLEWRSEHPTYFPDIHAKIKGSDSRQTTVKLNYEKINDGFSFSLPESDKGKIVDIFIDSIDIATATDKAKGAAFEVTVWSSSGKSYTVPFKVDALSRINRKINFYNNGDVKVVDLKPEQLETLKVKVESYKPRASTINSGGLIIQGLKGTGSTN